MPRHWNLVAPVPQWQVPADWKGCSFKPGFRVVPMSPSLRRALLDALKRQDGYSEHALNLLISTETVALAKGPLQLEHGGNAFSESLFFTFVADAFLRRLHECVNLFLVPPAPPGYWHSCWFLVERDRGATTGEKVRCLDHSWTPDTIPPETDFDAPDVSEAMDKVRDNWARLSQLCRTTQFIRLCEDPGIRRGLTQAGNANIEKQAEAMVRLLAKENPDPGKAPTFTASRRQSATWFLEGVRDAYVRKINALEAKQSAAGARLLRAFAFFNESILLYSGPDSWFTDRRRLGEPHSFIALTTCLEALFSDAHQDLTYQLGSRVAWLLAPQDAKFRRYLFGMVQKAYGLRSKIVHGSQYSQKDLESESGILHAFVRLVLEKIVSDKRLFATFFNAKPEECDQFLRDLAIGCAPGPGK